MDRVHKQQKIAMKEKGQQFSFPHLKDFESVVKHDLKHIAKLDDNQIEKVYNAMPKVFEVPQVKR